MATPTLSLTNLKAPIAKATGKAPARSIAALWEQINALPKAGETAPFYGRDPARTDGFNAWWYAKQRPDVVAAGMDLYGHYMAYGRYEGTPAYEGAAPFSLDSLEPHEFAILPAPQVEMPDLYYPLGTKVVYPQVRLKNFAGKRPYRTFEALLSLANAPGGTQNGAGLGYYDGGYTQSDTVFGAHNDWTIELEARILEEGPGSFKAIMSGGISHPQLGNAGNAECWVHIGKTSPPGYKLPPRPPRKPRPVKPAPKAWTYQTDFLGDLSDWHRNEFSINMMDGVFCGPETRTRQGRAPLADTLPIIDGVRRLKIVDLGPNSDTDDRVMHQGRAYRYAMPAIRKTLGTGLYGLIEVDFRYPQLPGLDPGMWDWDQEELDHLEIWAGTGRTHTVSFHTRHGVKPTYNPFGDGSLRRTLTILRTRDRYAQWQNGELIVDGPNYLGDRPFPFMFSIEGVGGTVAGPPDPTIRYGEVMADLHSLKFQQL